MSEVRSHILVVEDEPLSRDVIVRYLIGAGYTVSVAFDGADCLAWLAAGNRCDLILLDMAMPRLTGPEVIRAVRSRFSPDSLPIIVVSALADADDVVSGLDAGANDYVTKPVNFRELEARVQASLRMRGMVSLLVEAERQRVMIETLTRSAEKLGAPLRSVIDTLERAAQKSLADDETQHDFNQIAGLIGEVIDVIEKFKAAGQVSDLPYRQRLEILNGSAGED